MQKTLINIRNPYLIEYLAVAVEEERPHIKFLVVEEYLNGNCISLKNLADRIGDNNLMMQYFSEKTYLWRVILQTLKGIKYLND